MVSDWSNKTSSPLEDLNEVLKVMRKTPKRDPSLIYFEGEYYTFSEFAKLMESRKERS